MRSFVNPLIAYICNPQEDRSVASIFFEEESPDSEEQHKG